MTPNPTERRQTPAERRIANERMADYRHSVLNPPPDPYAKALDELREKDRAREANR